MTRPLAYVIGLWVTALVLVAALAPGTTTRKYDQTIYVRNLSQFVTDKAVTDALPAIQKAADEDFAKYWHTTAKLVFIGAKEPPQGSEFFVLIDKGRYKDALAFHRLIQGAPGSVVYVGTCKYYGYSWTIAFTHELWEQLADPSLIRTAQGQDGRIWANEVADPVESDSDGYWRTGAHGVKVHISDFITDKWYGDGGVSGPYDFTQHVQKPLTIRPGGYAQWYDPLTGWHIIENWRTAADRAWAKGEDR